MPTKPKLGQNFLHDAAAVERIVAALGDCSRKTVVEIGPGRGVVTRALTARVGHVFAVELDRELADRLSVQFPPERVTVVHEDILGFDFASTAEKAGQRIAVVGNLPYYITSPILLKLAASHAALDRAVLMMQREVADRVAAEPGSRDYGLLSVTVQLYGPVERLLTLPPGAFSPPPKVHSTVIRWRFSPRFADLDLDEVRFPRFVRAAFAQKRKTLANNLRAAGFSTDAIAVGFERASLNAQVRAEHLSIETFAALWKSFRASSQF
jgi:16S rRNA (adenine1518-N6/adenine1519-N6)-dimethyltransferase